MSPPFIEVVRQKMRDGSMEPIRDEDWVAAWKEAGVVYLAKLDAADGDEEKQAIQQRLDELKQLKARIIGYNYTIAILQKPFSEVLKKEIRDQFFGIAGGGAAASADDVVGGYVLVGYKGVSTRRAERMYDADLKWQVSQDDLLDSAGYSRGVGFYLTPHFASAREFALGAAQKVMEEEGAILGQRGELLQRPITPPPDSDVDILAKYRRDFRAFLRAEEQFKESDGWLDGWLKKGVVVRVYCKDFFAMRGLYVNDQSDAPSGWEKYDFIDAPMQGGGRTGESVWEIKFNKKEDVYTKLRVFHEPRCCYVKEPYEPALPRGARKMLDMVDEMTRTPSGDKTVDLDVDDLSISGGVGDFGGGGAGADHVGGPGAI